MAYSYTLLCRAEILYSIQGRHSRLYGVRGTSGGLGGLTRRGEERRRNADGTLSGARSCALCGSQARGGRGGALAGAAGERARGRWGSAARARVEPRSRFAGGWEGCRGGRKKDRMSASLKMFPSFCLKFPFFCLNADLAGLRRAREHEEAGPCPPPQPMRPRVGFADRLRCFAWPTD